MTFFIQFTTPGDAVGKGRPRFNTKSGRAFTPQKTRTKEGVIASLAMDAMDGLPPYAGPVSMNLEIIVGVAASWSKKRRELALSGKEYPTKKPDVDNVIKLAGDSLNGIVFVDDVQIVRVSASKTYGENPRTIVTITGIENGV